MRTTGIPRRVVRAFALVAALSLALALPVSANPGPTEIQPENPTPWTGELEGSPQFARNLWFVEFEGAPEIDGGSQAALDAERDALAGNAQLEGIEYDVRFDYTNLWNGMSVSADPAAAAALTTLDGVKAVYPVELVEAPEPEAINPDIATALAMTGADIAAGDFGLTGDGLKVAIVDTGIDYQHPDLGGSGVGTTFPTARVAYGFDYVGENYDASVPELSTPVPDPDPLDFQGHGTHVAGIVGANAGSPDGLTGVAPGVVFGAYKVFADGSSTADVIIEALEDAHADGMDIINMSLGASLAWGDYPTSQVSNQLVEEGIVVVASAGNSGRLGTFSLGAPGNGTDVIGVASADNVFLNANVFEIAGQDVGYLGISNAEEPPTTGTSDEIVYIGRACPSLGDVLEDDPAGKTALIIRGNCTFNEKYATAVAAGATGVVIHNQGAGLFSGGGVDPVAGVWAAAISDVDGFWLRSILGVDPVAITFTDRTTNVVNPTGGLISVFSSYGMTPDLEFRPDITAPGGLINSTYPLARGGYALLSGTSMSAPHVAGAVALLLEARPDLEASEVRSVLQNTAEPLLWSLAPGIGLLDHTFRQGAGMLRIDEALTSTTWVTPSRIELGDTPVVETTITIANDGTEAATYLLGHTGALGAGGFPPGPGDPGAWFSIFSPDFVGPTSSASFSTNSVTVAAGESVTVDVTISNPNFGLYAHQTGGFLTITEDAADGDSIVVPYAGLAGNLSDIEIWPAARPADTGLDNLIVAYDDNGDLFVAEPGRSFSRQGDDTPSAGVFMGFAAERVEVTARHVGTGYTVDVAEVDFARRSVDAFEYITFTWDGREQVGNSNGRRLVPRGEWVFDVRALKPRTSDSAPMVWEEGTTTSFMLERGPNAFNNSNGNGNGNGNGWGNK